MTKKIIDLSVALETGIISDPPMALPKIEYIDHTNSAEQICSFFPGLTKDDLPGGEGWAVEQLSVSTHNGTHLDAPYHFHSTMDGGKKSLTIDEVPCFVFMLAPCIPSFNRPQWAVRTSGLHATR